MKSILLILKILGIIFISNVLKGCPCCADPDDYNTHDCFTCEFDGADTETYCKADGDWEEYADSWEDYIAFAKNIDGNNDSISCAF